MERKPGPGEFTVICIDNSQSMLLGVCPTFQAQLDAIKFYCETLLKTTTHSMVCLIAMSKLPPRHLCYFTCDIRKILYHLKGVCRRASDMDFAYALDDACVAFKNNSPPSMKRRLLVFTVSRINLRRGDSFCIGKKLKELDVALNVFNFSQIDRPSVSHCNKYREAREELAREELAKLLSIVNHEGNSFLLDVEASSVRDMLSERLLKKNLSYLAKEAPAEMESDEAAVAYVDELTEKTESLVEWVLSENTLLQKEAAVLWCRHANYLKALAKLKSSRQAPDNSFTYFDPSKEYLAKIAAAVDEFTEKIEYRVKCIRLYMTLLKEEVDRLWYTHEKNCYGNPPSYRMMCRRSEKYIGMKAAAVVEFTENIENHVQTILSSTTLLQKERDNYLNAVANLKSNRQAHENLAQRISVKITCEGMKVGELRLLKNHL